MHPHEAHTKSVSSARGIRAVLALLFRDSVGRNDTELWAPSRSPRQPFEFFEKTRDPTQHFLPGRRETLMEVVNQ